MNTPEPHIVCLKVARGLPVLQPDCILWSKEPELVTERAAIALVHNLPVICLDGEMPATPVVRDTASRGSGWTDETGYVLRGDPRLVVCRGTERIQDVIQGRRRFQMIFQPSKGEFHDRTSNDTAQRSARSSTSSKCSNSMLSKMLRKCNKKVSNVN